MTGGQRRAELHQGRRPDRARGRGAADRHRLGDGDQRRAGRRERPDADVRRDRQHQPGAVQRRAGGRARRHADLHAGRRTRAARRRSRCALQTTAARRTAASTRRRRRPSRSPSPPSTTRRASPPAPTQTSDEDAGAQTVGQLGHGISAGPADESGQTLTFDVTDNTNRRCSAPARRSRSTGTLTYTPAPNAYGTATITLVLQDNGGTANGGVDTSAPQTFTITVNPVNDLLVADRTRRSTTTRSATRSCTCGAKRSRASLAVADTSSAMTKSGPTDVDGPTAPAFVPLSRAGNAQWRHHAPRHGSFSYVPNAEFHRHRYLQRAGDGSVSHRSTSPSRSTSARGSGS